MTTLRHAARIGLLMAGAAVSLGWVLRHTEVCFADGLRYIHQAEQIHRGDWQGALQGVDHPLHPLALAATHRLTGGQGPASWQRAALVLGFAAALLLVIPSYFLTHALLDDDAAWLASMLLVANPMVPLIVVNVLSESTFLLWWTIGLWGGVRFLRDWALPWLVLAVGASALAYLTRPEGLLLPAALAAAALVRWPAGACLINKLRAWPVVVSLVIGLGLLVGPYVAVRGGLGTKPGIARVMGWAAPSHALALERERPLPPDQSSVETYRAALLRLQKVLRSAVGSLLYPIALVGVGMAALSAHRPRERLFLGIILAASCVALVRLYATAGYCTGRHGLVPGMVLTLAAALVVSRVTRALAIPGRWLGISREWLRHSPTSVSLLFVAAVVVADFRSLGPLNHGPFSVYRAAGEWLRTHTRPQDQVLDLNDWVLYFSDRHGYAFANVYEAAADPRTRWLVVRRPHVDGHNHFSEVLRERIAGRAPVACVPADASPHQVQIRIYDCHAPRESTALTGAPRSRSVRRPGSREREGL